MLAHGPPRLEGSLVDPPISPGPRLREVERRQRSRELHDVPRASFLEGDRQRRVEGRRREARGGGNGEDNR